LRREHDAPSGRAPAWQLRYAENERQAELAKNLVNLLSKCHLTDDIVPVGEPSGTDAQQLKQEIRSAGTCAAAKGTPQ